VREILHSHGSERIPVDFGTARPNPLPSGEHRRHPRQLVSSIIYVRLNDGNGGILLNLGEGGLSFHAAVMLNPRQDVDLRFKLPDTGESIRLKGQAAWLGPTRKEVGISFNDVPVAAREKIARWVVGVTAGPYGTREKATQSAFDQLMDCLGVTAGPYATKEKATPAMEHVPENRVAKNDLPASRESSSPPGTLSWFLASRTALESPPTPGMNFPAQENQTEPLAIPVTAASSTSIPVEMSAPVEPPPTGMDEEPTEGTGNAPSIPSAPRQSIPEQEPLQPIDSLDGSRQTLRNSHEAVNWSKVGTFMQLCSTYWERVKLALALIFRRDKHGRVPAAAGILVLGGIFLLIMVALTWRGQAEHSSPSVSSKAGAPAGEVVQVQQARIPRTQPSASWLTKLMKSVLGEAAYSGLDSDATGVTVWVDHKSGFYYCGDSPFFEKLHPGSLLSQGEALQSGYQPKIGSYCH
jgi:PilZ domain